MDSSVAPVVAQSAASLPSSALAATPLAGLKGRRLVSLIAGVIGLVAIIALAALWSRTPDYRVLFTNLGDRDGGSVIAALTQMNIPYRYAEGGGAILVPEDRVHDARLRLASQGLPKGGTVGFELMENQKFGVTQFQERLNFQRGLEGELARSIQSLSAVQNARVHLALPAQSGFLRDQQKPSASVLLTLHPARGLDRSQVDGIVHLVASSVPDLAPTQVSVIDQNGALLSNREQVTNGLDPSQIGYVRQLESDYNRRITDIIGPLVGMNNVRAQVTADVDFTQSESTAEEYRPNQGKDAQSAIRSQQTSEGSSTDPSSGQGAQGIAGALSNQPPPQSSAPINGQAQPLGAAGANANRGAAGSAGGSSRREATTNYELDKTVRVTRNASGTIRRLSAAVVLNHRKSVDKNGKTVITPLSEQEIEQITALVREAIGLSKERGDTVNVVSAAFNREEDVKVDEVPMWRQPETIAIGKEAGKHLVLILLGLFTIFGVIRPALKQPKGAKSRIDETVQGELQLPPVVGGGKPSSPDALKLARDDPAAVANVVRSWVGSNNG